MRLLLLTTLLGVSLVIMTGCGGGGGGGATASSAHQYLGQGSLDPSKTGQLLVNVAGNGSISGDLQVTGSGGSVFSLGDWPLTGSVDATKHFTLTGNAGGILPFTVTGILPTEAVPQDYLVQAGANQYTGSLSVSPTMVGWESCVFNLANGGYNGLTTSFRNDQGPPGVIDKDNQGVTTVSAVFDNFAFTFDPNGVERTCGFSLYTAGSVHAGTTISIGDAAGVYLSNGFYNEAVWQGNSQVDSRLWVAVSGSVTIDSVDQGSFSFHGQLVLSPRTGGSSNSAVGNITLNLRGSSLR